MKWSKEIAVAILVLVAIGLFIYGYNFLKGDDFFQRQTIYYATYPRVDGLSKDNPIQINGFNVGKVREVYLNPNNTRILVVEMSITEPGLNLPINTVARISSLDLLGARGIALEIGDTAAMAQNGDTLLGRNEEGLTEQVSKQLSPLKTKSEELIGSIDSVVTIVQAILNKEAREALTASLESVKRSFATFENTAFEIDSVVRRERARIELIVQNVEGITRNIRQNNENLTAILSNTAAITDTLKNSQINEAIASANASLQDLEQMIEIINSGQGTLGKMMYNDSLYNNLNTAALNLDSLINDLEENPHKYVHLSVFDFHREGAEKKPKKKKKK